jgi:hypothetical protein
MNRQYISVKFRPGDARSYTYHADEPYSVGDEVKIGNGDEWSRATVVGIGHDKPRFDTKPILGVAPPKEQR